MAGYFRDEYAPWRVQPQIGAVGVDWANPANSGLIFADLPAGNGVIDASGNARGVLSASGFSSVLTAYGRSLDCAATGVLQIDAGTNALYDLSGELTLMALITPDNAGGGSFGQYVLGSGNVSATVSQGALRIKGKVGAVYGGGFLLEGATTLTSGNTYLVGFSREGTTGTRTVTVYVNGLSDGSTTSATSPGTQQVFALGSFGAATGFGLPFDGRIHAARVFKRALTGADWLACYQNIWSTFAPQTRRIWVPVSAGGTDGNASTAPAASTLTAPTATGSGSAQASTAPAGSTLTAPTATATGTAAGHATATGAPAGLNLTAPTATASGSAQASGEPASAPLTAPTGTASSAGHATASGIPAGLVLTAPTATATGSAQAFAAFITALLTAPTGTASNGEAPESGHSSAGYGGGGGSGHVGARERLRSRKALADLFEDIKLVKPKEKVPELTEHQEQTIQHALEVVREAQEAVRQTLEKLAEASPPPAQLKTLQAKLRQLEADLEEEEAAVVSLLLL